MYGPSNNFIRPYLGHIKNIDDDDDDDDDDDLLFFDKKSANNLKSTQFYNSDYSKLGGRPICCSMFASSPAWEIYWAL